MAPISNMRRASQTGAEVKDVTQDFDTSHGNGASESFPEPLVGVQVSQKTSKDIARPSSYFGHDSKEVTRLIIQALGDLGYPDIAKSLIDQSGYDVEAEQVRFFRRAVLDGQWETAEKLLVTLELDNGDKSSQDTKLLHTKFLLYRQEYLEAIEHGDSVAALNLLQHKLAKLNIHKSELHALSELALVGGADELKEVLNSKGIGSRTVLLSSLEEFLSPSVMIPPHRLATLLHKVSEYEKSVANYYVSDDKSNHTLYRDYVDKRENFPIRSSHILAKHTDEVWHVSFSHDGKKMTSASKDSTIIVWDTATFDPETCMVLKAHEKGVLAVEWSPDDNFFVSTASDHQVMLWNGATGAHLYTFIQHTDVVGSVGWLPDSRHFITGSPDKKLIMWDVSGRHVYQWESNRVMNLAISPDGKKMVVLCHDSVINLYDLETKNLVSCVAMDRVLSCVSISRDSRYALINVAKDEVFLWDLETVRICRKYVGQQQTEFMIRSCFGGALENFILSGSEDSNIYVWNRSTTDLIEVLPGHTGTVNCVAWDPKGRPLFASAGDDSTVRIWEPPLQ